MALDGLVVRSLVHELSPMTGVRINKIYQPTEYDIVIQLRAQGSNYKLLLSANPTYPRIHLTDGVFLNPTEAPMFCMLLRKHCEGGIIEDIRQIGMERIVHLTVRQRDELGDISVKTIVIEIMGRHSNIILTDPATGNVLDGIHHVTPAISSYRIVMPGCSYVSPPDQGKEDPLTVSEAAFLQAMSESPSEPDSDSGTQGLPAYDQKIVRQYSGISPLVAKEIVYRAALGSADLDLQAVWTAFRGIMSDIASHQYRPTIVEETKSGKAFFSVIELSQLKGETEAFESASACLESYYGEKAEKDTVKQRVADLHRFLQNERSKNIKKLDKLDTTLQEARNADQYRILGELLTASLHQLHKGDKSAEVVNYYDENQATVKVELDPQLSPSDNAQRYYKKYTKMKNSLIAVQEQIQSTHEEVAYMDSLLQQLNDAALTDIDEIREELVEQGYLRNRSKKQKKKKKADNKPALSCFLSSEGIPLYVGKNNTQNEYVTNRLAGSSDTWLHTKDIPGSHVVIRSASYGEATLHEAAQLAAYYSQAKSSSQVPVDYTLIKHVRKPNGAKPGFVIYDNQKTLFVTPDEKLVKGLQPNKA